LPDTDVPGDRTHRARQQIQSPHSHQLIKEKILMVLVTGNWKLWMVGMAASLAIFLVLFFTVIKPSSDTANQAVKSGLQQSQQVLNQAQKQITNAGGANSSVTKQAK
jgi:hypothetical protein